MYLIHCLKNYKMCYIRLLPATQKLKELKFKLNAVRKQREALDKENDRLVKLYDKEKRTNCQQVITACSDKCQVIKKRKSKFKCVFEPDRCKTQCAECKYAVRCMKIGRHQNIFPHKTNNVKPKQKNVNKH